jgi:hypothetical protein
MTDLKSIATAAETAVEAIAKVEGPILTGVGIFVPGASAVTVPLQAILPLIIPDIEKALNDIAKGSYSDIFLVAREFVQHITQGMPNSPILSAVEKAVGPITAG